MSALQARRCGECGKVSAEEKYCARCGSERGEMLSLSGRGKLLSWTTIRVAPARYAAEAPFNVGIVELDEGVRMTARIDGDPERFSQGQRLTLSSVDAARGPIFAAA